MKKYFIPFLILLLCVQLCGCSSQNDLSEPRLVAATTYPVYQFTAAVVQDTDVHVSRIIGEAVSCLHDYSLTVRQMKLLSRCDAVVISGLELEHFMEDVLPEGRVIDASQSVSALCASDEHEHEHEHEEHEHEHEAHEHEGHEHGELDPHIWLDPANAAIMTRNICAQLSLLYPDQAQAFEKNTQTFCAQLEQLAAYGREELKDLSCRDLITFHDGFSYFAQAFELRIAAAMEIEAGSEPAARELEEIVELVRSHGVPAVFDEASAGGRTAGIVAHEAAVPVYTLDMAMGELDYFSAQRQNIQAVKEALS